MTSRARRTLIAVFVVALLLRVVFVVIWYGQGRAGRFAADTQDYYRLAQSINEGRGYSDHGAPATRRPPLFALFIALTLRFSAFPLGVYILQALLGALCCVLLFGIGTAFFGTRPGLVASALLAVHYYSVRQTASLLPEALFVFLLLAGFGCLAVSWSGKKMTWLFAGGALLGLAVLTKDVVVFFFPVAALWPFLWREPLRRRAAYAALFLAGGVVAVGPWMARNSLVTKDVTMVTATAGHTFYLANNPRATGGTTGGEWEAGIDTSYPNDPDLPPLYTPAADRYLFKKALAFIAGSPGEFLALSGRKIVNMWRPYQTDSPRAARWATGLSYGCIMLFALPGMIVSLRRWRDLYPLYALVAYYFVFHAILIAQIRYRYPVMPLFMLFAAVSICQVLHRAKGRTD